jgi:Domain of unknown function (DUF4417)/ParB-like nuclease domain
MAQLKMSGAYEETEPWIEGSNDPNEPIGDVEYGVVLSSLKYYYQNPRRGNVEKLAESLNRNGQYKTITVNRGTHTGREREILAGNHTVKAAKKLGWKRITVMWVDVTEEHARRIVLADNGSTDDATYDAQILADLIAKQQQDIGHLVGTTYNQDVLDKLMVEVNTDPLANVDMIEDAPTDMDGVGDLNDYVFFDSEADFEIPVLRLDRIPEQWPEKLDVWAGRELDEQRQNDDPDLWWLATWHTGLRGINWQRAIVSMYTEDFHFTGCFEDPGLNTKKLLNLGIPMAIMPNFSVNLDWPVYTWIWAVARSFYVGRYWQEAGIQVIPDLQYGGSDEALELGLAGIPERCPIVAAQVQNERGDNDKIRTTARLLRQAEERIGFHQIMIYGHTDADKVVQYAGFDCEVIRVSNRTSRRRQYLDGESGSIAAQQVRSKKRRPKDGD